MKTLITRASLVAGLTGGILLANVAVESAAPVTPVIPVSRRVHQVTASAGTNSSAAAEPRFRFGHLARRRSGISDADGTGDHWRTDRPRRGQPRVRIRF
jgi:hypothetical protein